MRDKRKTIAIDFDGVIHKYDKGFLDGSIYDEPEPGAKECLDFFIKHGYHLVIFTCRDEWQVREWMLTKMGFSRTMIDVTNTKPVAAVYIDDNGLRFDNWTQVMDDLYRLNILSPDQDLLGES